MLGIGEHFSNESKIDRHSLRIVMLYFAGIFDVTGLKNVFKKENIQPED